MDKLRIGVDVGGTNLRAGVVRGNRVLWQHRHTADFSGICRANPAPLALEKITAELAAVVAHARGMYPDAVSAGIAFPGFIEPGTGKVSLSPNLPGLRDADIASPLARQLGMPVRIDNDALAAAWGEYHLAVPPPQSLVYLGLGTGVGGGLVLNGKPWPGQHGVSMEVGHLIVAPGGRPCGCGNLGCLEQYASASGVAISYRELAKSERDAEGVAALAAQGDAPAVEAFRIAAQMLATALAHIQKVVDVETVVIGGGMAAAWPILEPRFNAYLDADLIPALRGRIRVSASTAGDQAGMLGAALLAIA